ncbi:MAG: YqjK family protein [Rhodocyclaceae bacterium]|nr:YqjK family protein [Rhodocyclaceae bacterium]
MFPFALKPVELALEKQRLEFAAASQREALARHVAGLTPLFDAADQVGAGLRWTRHHPEVLAGAVLLLAAARPGVRSFIWRWTRRGFVAWRLWRNGNRWLNQPHRV